MPGNRTHWAVTALFALFLAAAGLFVYLKLSHLPPNALGIRGDAAVGVALLIVVGKILLKGLKNKDFKLHEQGEENCLLAVGAAVPTAVDYVLQQKAGQGEWLAFAGGALLALFFAIYASSTADAAPKNSKERSAWSTASVVLGSSSFLLYMFLVVLKTR